MLRDEGLSELLPACNTVILDEAHQLPDTATLFFGEQVSAGQLAELARDAEVAARAGARSAGLPDAAATSQAVAARLTLGDVPELVRGTTVRIHRRARCRRRTRPSAAGGTAERGEVDNCAPRATEASATLGRWIHRLNEDADAADNSVPAWVRWLTTSQGGSCVSAVM